MTPEELFKSKYGLIKLTLSIFAVQFMVILVNNIDQLMLSRYSQTSVAAVGNANQISWVLLLLYQILSMASTILITQYKGAEDRLHEQQVYAISLAVNTLISIIIGLVFIFGGHSILRIMNVTDPAIEPDAYIYMAITGGGSIFTAIILTYFSFMRGNAMMLEAIIAALGVNAINIAGNWMLIYGVGPFPRLGVLGAAISTTVSRALGAAVLAIIFRVRNGKIPFRLLWPFPFDQLRKLLHLGVPSAGEAISYDLAMLVVMRFVNTLGLVAINTKIYASLVVQIAYIFTNALAEGTQLVEGYFLGAKEHEKAHRRVMRTVRIGILCSLTLTAIIYFASDTVLGLFIPSGSDADAIRADVLTLGKKILAVDLMLELGRAVNLVLVKALQGAGDSVFPAVLCTVTCWLLAAGGGWLLGIHFGLGLIGIWIGMTADECVRAVATLIRWKRGGWRRIDLVRTDASLGDI